ncbi:Hypothetical protein POVN_LOCUS587 [uncultured virus]|nr:Hypothetical protein POVN_LOCUS587 [uncultured virus]
MSKSSALTASQKGTSVDKPFQATNMVMVTILDGDTNISLPALYELLTIVKVDYTIGTKHAGGSRVKIPYFGLEGILVSVRFNMKSRGIRNQGGQLRNVVSIDLQYAGKNIHLKVSSKKIALMGALTEQMGTGAFQMLLDHMHMVEGHWRHIRGLDQDARQAALRWLCETLLGTPVEGSDAYTLKKFDDLGVTEAFANPPADVDKRAVTYLAMFASEFTYYHEFVNKLNTLFELTTSIYDRAPLMGPPKITNAVYNYSIGQRVSLIMLCRRLHELGYGVSYHNWHKAKAFRVMIPIEQKGNVVMELDEDDGTPLDIDSTDDTTPISDDEVTEPVVDVQGLTAPEKPRPHKESKMPAHRFTIYQGGSIRQSSPTIHTIAEQVKQRLVADVLRVLAAQTLV